MYEQKTTAEKGWGWGGYDYIWEIRLST